MKKLIKFIKFILYRFRYLINYGMIGVGAVGLEIAILSILRYFNFNLFLAAGIGFIIGMVFSYILNFKLNFKLKNSLSMITRFTLVSVASFGVNLLLCYWLSIVTNVGYGLLRYFTASIIFVINYFIHRKVTFTGLKKVGIVVYADNNTDVDGIWSKIENFPDFIHIDLIDDREVNLEVVKQVKKKWFLPSMLHIMSNNPIKWVKEVGAYSDYIIVPFDKFSSEIYDYLKASNKKIGISIMPDADLDELEPMLNAVDLVQVMGITALGKSGQSISTSSIGMLEFLSKNKKKYNFEICFDGGIQLYNVNAIKADYIVSSSAVLNSENAVQTIYKLKSGAIL